MGTKLHQMPKMPRRMKERFQLLFGNDYERFEDFCRQDVRRSFRINTLKAKREEVIKMLSEKGISLESIPWTDLGFWTDEKNIGNTFEHFMGYIYMQGPASMIPAIILEPKPGEVVLDMCAAPGSKSTQIAAMMENKGVLFSNDKDYKRLNMLRFNNDKSGVLNSVILNKNGKDFAQMMPKKFDRILLDAPCSGEGIITREWDVVNRWTMKDVIGLCRLQKALIDSAIGALKPEGTLVYSTCTLSPEENEEVIDHALKNEEMKIEKISLDGLKSRPGITEWERFTYDGRVKNCMRIWPQDNKTEGFFVAKLTKGE